MPTLRNISGNGVLPENAIITYSYSEDATPLDLNTAGSGAGQVEITIESADQARGSRLLVNNDLEIVDNYFGSLQFTDRHYTQGSDGTGTLTGETVAYKLNSYRAAPPIGGAGADLYEAILTYCALVGITPVIASELQTKLAGIPVNFIGWVGNLWAHLEMLCQAVSLDTDDNTYLEMAVIDNQLHFREALKSEISISDRLTEKSLTVESYDASQFLTLNYYNTFYGSNRIVREQNPSKNIYAINEHVSITDSMQVQAGETVVKRVKINASLESVNQPVAVAQITTLPFPLTGSFGEYVIVGSDDYPVDPAQWVGEGGSLLVRLTDVPDEIEIIVTAPKSVQLPTVDGSPEEVTLAPYKIGVEASDGAEYPALYITGTGVFFEKKLTTIPTGASSEYAPSLNTSSIDNLFICTKNDLLTRGVAAAQVLCGPNVTYTATAVDGLQFGSSVGSIVADYDTKFRITTIDFSEAEASISGKSYVSFSDFNSAWSGATFSDFGTENSGLTFNEFTVIPLVRN